MKKKITIVLSGILFLTGQLMWSCQTNESAESAGFTDSNANWSEYLGGPHRNHYSTLEQITPENVSELEVAWIYHTMDTGQIQCNPIIVDGKLYGMTATTQPFSINAATGEEFWRNKS